jgi:hypothetical protein
MHVVGADRNPQKIMLRGEWGVNFDFRQFVQFSEYIYGLIYPTFDYLSDRFYLKFP